MFAGVLNSSMLWKAQKDGFAKFEIINLRDFGLGARRTVDDTPYGGGDGMLLRIEPLVAAIEFAKSQDEIWHQKQLREIDLDKSQDEKFREKNSDEKIPRAKVLLMTPCENLWNQQMATNFAKSQDNYIIICGHYEGFDARVDEFVDAKISVGKYVLTGGEIPAMALIDSVVRLIPGVLGGENSAAIESYSDGANLEFPQFTRPEKFRDLKVPEVLLSGNHAEIAKWRDENSTKIEK